MERMVHVLLRYKRQTKWLRKGKERKIDRGVEDTGGKGKVINVVWIKIKCFTTWPRTWSHDRFTQQKTFRSLSFYLRLLHQILRSFVRWKPVWEIIIEIVAIRGFDWQRLSHGGAPWHSMFFKESQLPPPLNLSLAEMTFCLFFKTAN